MNKIIYWLFLTTFVITACQQSDSKKIIGKWQNDDSWFEYFEDKTYSSGRAYIEMVKGFKYQIDEQKKELNMYTDIQNQIFYLQYEFRGNDTLLLNNLLNTNQHFVTYYRVKNQEPNKTNR